MKNNKNRIMLITDKLTNLFYTYVNNIHSSIQYILLINKFIYTLICTNKKLLNLKTRNNTILNTFNNVLKKIITFLNVTNSINIIINKIKYPSLFIYNKLIIRIGNLKNIIVYLPNIESVSINMSEKGDFISIASANKVYMTNLALLIKSIKKVDVCTGIGMNYENEKIMFKRKIINDIRK